MNVNLLVFVFVCGSESVGPSVGLVQSSVWGFWHNLAICKVDGKQKAVLVILWLFRQVKLSTSGHISVHDRIPLKTEVPSASAVL